MVKSCGGPFVILGWTTSCCTRPKCSG